MRKIEKSKNKLEPYIVINGPNYKNLKIVINKERITIGRLKNANDISFDFDPQKLVSRCMHCSIELKNETYWIIDNASKNGTFINQGGQLKRVHGEAKLRNNDLILILAHIDSQSETKYWEIKFYDPLATEDASIYQYSFGLFYDWIQTKLFVLEDRKTIEITGITPQEHKVIRYMDEKNRNNKNVSVMCTYEELIDAVWDDHKEFHTKNDINHLIWGLKRKINRNSSKSEFIINVRGMGYRLISNPNNL